MAERNVKLELTSDEALVFLAWLHRFNQAELSVFEDQAEQRVLWDIESMLESALAEPLHSRYDELLADARARVRDV